MFFFSLRSIQSGAAFIFPVLYSHVSKKKSPFPLAASRHVIPASSFPACVCPSPSFTQPAFPSSTAALSSLSLGGHLGLDKTHISSSAGSLPCRRVMIQARSQALAQTLTYSWISPPHLSKRSRKRVGLMF